MSWGSRSIWAQVKSFRCCGMASPVVAEWLRHEALTARAQHGKIALVANPEVLNRGDVVNNADAVGPVIQHLGLRPSVDAIQEHVEILFYNCRPRGKRPLERNFAALHQALLDAKFGMFSLNADTIPKCFSSFEMFWTCRYLVLRQSCPQRGLGASQVDFCVQSGCKEGALP